MDDDGFPSTGEMPMWFQLFAKPLGDHLADDWKDRAGEEEMERLGYMRVLRRTSAGVNWTWVPAPSTRGRNKGLPRE